ncbi:hypothetical protein EWB00_005338 [Schistosoma japonicum]|uniref:C-type lectin domain-containing protein n=2 Tax=Schistosoma japonicum TaxID=6182 RepID=A0A4Z2D2H0_SCHJA|nr:hypothetical protein EWB00_005338 [Schistosoma japonicum]
MLKFSQTSLIVTHLIHLFFIESRLQTEQLEGYRVERVGLHGRRINFTWYKNVTIHSWVQAAEMCSNLNSLLPKVNDMRYFYKTLQSDNIVSLLSNISENMTHSGVVFYLGDVLEATMDYPSIESGERMCLTVEKVPGFQLHLAERSAVKSCLTHANLLVCKSEVDSSNSAVHYDDDPSLMCSFADDKWFGPLPKWILDLKQKAEFKQDHICLRKLLFYVVAACSGFVVVIFITSTVILAIRYRSMILKINRRQMGMDGNNVWSQSSEMSSQCPLGEADGRLDILADSTFRRDPSGFGRESYKEALVNSGYQRISSGRIKSLRTSGKPRSGTVIC